MQKTAGWRPIAEADKSIAYIHQLEELRIGNSYPIWARDEDGRVFETVWSDNGKKAYWWDLEGESPVDPVEFMPHPLDPHFSSRPSLAVAWPLDTEDQVEALARECDWDNRKYMTPKDYSIWCERMRKFARLASVSPVQSSMDVLAADDWGQKAFDLATAILTHLGIGTEPSGDPGVDRRRDHLCRLIEAALSPDAAAQDKLETVPAELCKLTFALQHNPNCPSPWLVRLAGKGPIDMKPYADGLGFVSHQTGDILGFGKTFNEADRSALSHDASRDVGAGE